MKAKQWKYVKINNELHILVNYSHYISWESVFHKQQAILKNHDFSKILWSCLLLENTQCIFTLTPQSHPITIEANFSLILTSTLRATIHQLLWVNLNTATKGIQTMCHDLDGCVGRPLCIVSSVVSQTEEGPMDLTVQFSRWAGGLAQGFLGHQSDKQAYLVYNRWLDREQCGPIRKSRKSGHVTWSWEKDPHFLTKQ